MTAPTIEFQTVDRPKVTRSGKPNPYRTAIAEFIAAGEQAADKAVSFTLPMGKAVTKDVKVKSKVTGQRTFFKDVENELAKLRNAAPDGYGVRTQVSLDSPSKGVATVAFWVKAKEAKVTETSEQA